jgi:hypothetical protein
MHQVVGSIDVKYVEQHLVWSHRRDEAENANEQEGAK